tara:strand:+ start:982 stop:1158 length:177 start_codon:yes stop_codon:yes gene_type:complete
MTTKPTDQELQAELAKVVKEHNAANDIVQKCKMRYAEIQAVLLDRGAPLEPPKTEPTT